MSLFRNNYLPKGEILRDSQTGKYFMSETTNSFSKQFVQYEDLTYGISWSHESTQFDSIGELLKAMYDYAYQEHIKQIHKSITYSKGIKV